MDSGSKDWLGSIWVFLVGLSLSLSGAFFCWWLWATWEKACAMDDWREVPAEVISSEVRSSRFNEFSRPVFFPVIRYRYEAAGESQVGEAIRRVPVRSADEEQARKWVKRFPVGLPIRAYVDPHDPGRAVLRRDTKASLYAIWFPLLFVATGLGMAINALRGRAKNRAPLHPNA